MEKEFKKLEKNALGCMYVATALTSIIVLGILTAGFVALELYTVKVILVAYIVIIVIAVLNIFISPYFRYHRYRYMLDGDSLELIEGYIFISHKIVPIERIQNIELKQGPIDRLYGVSKMIITTGGSEITVRFVSKTVADHMSEKLKNKINEYIRQDETQAFGEEK